MDNYELTFKKKYFINMWKSDVRNSEAFQEN